MRTGRGQRVAAAWAVRGQPCPAVGAELPVRFDLAAAIEEPCVATVMARYGIRRTQNTAGSRQPRAHKEGGERAGLWARRARCLPSSFDDRGYALRLVSADAPKKSGEAH